MSFGTSKLMVNKSTKRWLLVIATLALSLSFFSPQLLAGKPTSLVEELAKLSSYVSEDAMISMRDGVKLHAQIWRPRTQEQDLPIILSRSPYGFSKEGIEDKLNKDGSYGLLAADKYVFVFQDIRGRFGSEGDFVTMRPKNSDVNGIDESTDTYDTIDWLVKNLPKNKHILVKISVAKPQTILIPQMSHRGKSSSKLPKCQYLSLSVSNSHKGKRMIIRYIKKGVGNHSQGLFSTSPVTVLSVVVCPDRSS
mgnify:CR=1 FL=1